ncbi:hypothetical protein B5E56_03505 [Flavonifractor sp. An112]|nr:hypothetical protein B5E56_03505 [Flavonifractor sp. An112]
MALFFVAAASMAAGAAVGFAACWVAHKLRGGKRAKQKTKIGTMDKILLLEAVVLIAYTIAALAVFWHTGTEPSTLTACVFSLCGVENGVMGWIKNEKQKKEARAPAGNAPEPPEDRQEPPDVGIQGGNAP